MATQKIPEPVSRLARRIRRSSVFEDRLEYDVQDLMLAYGLSRADGEALRRELHRLAGRP